MRELAMPAVDPLPMPPSTRELCNKAAIVGIGETDYYRDYQAWRARAPGTVAPGQAAMVKTAFERALADSGLDRKDIDGLSVSLAYGQSDPADMAEALALKPSYLIANGNIMAGPLPVACAAIAAGKCNTIAMVYAVASRSGGRQFGGSTYSGGWRRTRFVLLLPSVGLDVASRALGHDVFELSRDLRHE